MSRPTLFALVPAVALAVVLALAVALALPVLASASVVDASRSLLTSLAAPLPNALAARFPLPAALTAAPRVHVLRGKDATGFHFVVSVVAKYAELQTQLNQALRGNEYRYGNHKFRVGDIRLSGGNGRTLVRVDVSGALRGQLFLTGTPVYDADTGVLAIPDLDYAFTTKNLLAKVGDWFNHVGWRDTMRDKVKWDVHEALASSLYGDHGPFTVSGSLDRPKVLELTSQRDGIHSRLELDGDIRFAMRPLSAGSGP